jgi:hypothetical protein
MFSTVLRAGARVPMQYGPGHTKIDFLVKIQINGARGHKLAVTRIKDADSGVARNRMTSASGFTWVAREP